MIKHKAGDQIIKSKYKSGDQINLDLGVELAKTNVENQPEGFFAGIASTPSVDLYGHKVLKGAFDKSIKQKGLNFDLGLWSSLFITI